MKKNTQNKILLLLSLFSLILARSRDYLSCTYPLGLQNGAISSDQIICSSIYPYDSQCATYCYDVRPASFLTNTFLCGYASSYFKVTFPEITIVTGVLVDVSNRRTSYWGRISSLQKIYVEYGRGDTSYYQTKEYDLPNSTNYIWFDKPLLATNINIRSILPASGIVTGRFELFGCTFWNYGKSMGLSSGRISDNQMAGLSSYDDPPPYVNPFAARLDTARMNGFRASSSTVPSWLKVDLGIQQKIISIQVQQNIPGMTTYATIKYKIYYGNSAWSSKPYTTDTSGLAMFISPPRSNSETEISQHVFKHPLLAQYIEYHPDCSNYCPFVKLELFGVSIVHPDHHWTFLSGSMVDQVMLRDFSSTNPLISDGEGIYLESGSAQKIQTLDVMNEKNCFLSPDDCDSGLSVAFTSKVPSSVSNGINKIHSVTAASMFGSSCETSNFDFANNIGIFIPNVKRLAEVEIFTDAFIKITDSENGNNAELQRKAKIYVAKTVDFTTSCLYQNSVEKALYSVDVMIKRDNGFYNILGLKSLLSKASTVADWTYETTITIVLEIISGSTDGGVTFPVLATLEGQLHNYFYYVCNGKTFEYIKSGSNAVTFTDKTSCGGTNQPSNANPSEPYFWKDCHPGDNYLQIDFHKSIALTMLQVYGDKDNYPSTFTVQYSLDNAAWLDINNDDSTLYIFKKKEFDSEYLAFPTPIYARYLRIHPKTFEGSFFKMKIDVVTCSTMTSSKFKYITAENYYVKASLTDNESDMVLVKPVYLSNYPNYFYHYTHPVGIDGISGIPSYKYYCLTCLYDSLQAVTVDEYYFLVGSQEVLTIPNLYLDKSPLPNGYKCKYFYITAAFKLCYGTDDRIYYYDGTNSFKAASVRAVKQIVASATDRMLYVVDDGDGYIYKHAIGVTSRVGDWELLSTRQCSEIRMSKNDKLWCRTSSIIYRWDDDDWIVILKGVDCSNFDVGSNFIICVGSEMKVKRFEYGSDSTEEQPNEFPVISYGLQRSNGKSYGTGFQISYSVLHASFVVAVQTATKIFEAVYPINKINGISTWNDYSFSWSKDGEKLVLFIAGEEVYSTFGVVNSYTPVLSNYYINIGSFYDHTYSYVFGFGLRDLKLWGNHFESSYMKLAMQRKSLTPLLTFPRYIGTKCDKVTIDESEENWYCLETNKEIIRLHPVIPALTRTRWVNRWKTHSYQKCTKFENFLSQLFCLDPDTKVIHIWFNETWTGLGHSEPALDFAMLYDKTKIGFIGEDEKLYGFSFSDFLACRENTEVLCPEETELFATEAKYIQYDNGKNYIFSISDDVVDVRTYDGFLSDKIDTFDENICVTIIVYKDVLWCLQNDEYVYRKHEKNWILEVDRKCKDFKVTDLYIVCAFNNLIIKWRHTSVDISFSEDEYSKNEDNSFRVAGTCYTSSSGPCFDASVYLNADPSQKSFYLGTDKFDFKDSDLHCLITGGRLASVHSEDEMNRVFNTPGQYLGKSEKIWLGLKNHAWSDRSSYNYNKFTGDTQNCARYNPDGSDKMAWESKDCDDKNQYMCQANGALSMKKTHPYAFYYINTAGECTMRSYDKSTVEILLILNEPTRQFTTLLFDLADLQTKIYINQAHLTYTATEDSSDYTWQLSIGILNNASCLYTAVYELGIYLEDIVPIDWQISPSEEDDVIVSPNLADMFRVYMDKYRSHGLGKVPIILTWTSESDSAHARKMKQFTLLISYQYRGDSNFLVLPSPTSQRSKPPYPHFITPAFPKDRQTFSFWYYIYGSNAGSLMAWFIDSSNTEDPYPFLLINDRVEEWRNVRASPKWLNVACKLLFVTFGQTGRYADIAIDSIESSTYYHGGNINSQHIPGFSIALGRQNTDYFDKYQLPRPKLLYLFKTTVKDYGSYEKDLSMFETITRHEWTFDKFMYPLNALKVTKELNNAILQAEGITQMEVDVKNEFSILFHLKFEIPADDVTFCQFGKNAEKILQVNIVQDKLVIRSNNNPIYTSTWSFVNNTWTYVAIVYEKETLFIYANTTMDNQTVTLQLDDITPFPVNLYFFRDPANLGLPANIFYEGYVSCFQFYNEKLSSMYVESLEFCPDRFEKDLCPRTCMRGGVCKPLKADCICPSYIERFYSVSCTNALSGLYFQNTYLGVHGDWEKSSINDTYLEDSPVNRALCVNETNVLVEVISNNCMKDLSTCADFVLSLWFYVDEWRDIGYATFFKFGNLVIAGNFTIDVVNPGSVEGEVKWQSSTKLCTKKFVLPIKAWVFMSVRVSTNHQFKYVFINQVKYTSGFICESDSVELSTSEEEGRSLYIGNVSKLCVDEIYLEEYVNWKTDQNKMFYYQAISKNILDGTRPSAVASSGNLWPEFELSVMCNTTFWDDDLDDSLSIKYKTVSDYTLSIVSTLLSFTADTEVRKFETGENGTAVAYVTVKIHQYLSTTITKKFVKKLSVQKNHRYCDIERTKRTLGVPHTAVNFTVGLLNAYTIQINISNVDECIVKRSHQNFYVYTNIYYVDPHVFHTTDHRYILTGASTFTIDSISYRNYHLTIYSRTHEGFSPPSELRTIITPSTANIIPPTILSIQPYNKTAIRLTWEEYTKHKWNSPVFYGFQLFFLKTPNEDNITLFETVNNTTALEYIVTDLGKFTEYRFFLGTVNGDGLGALSPGQSQRSGEDVPEMAPNVTDILLIGPTTVKIIWDLLPHDIDIYNSYVLGGYEVYIFPIFPSLVTPQGSDNKSYVTENSDNWVLHAAETNEMVPYKFHIWAYNNVTGENVKNEYCFVYGRTVPGLIQTLNVTFGPARPNDLSSVNISVGNILLVEENTVITHYNITYKSMDWSDTLKTLTLNVTHTNEELTYWESLKTTFLECSAIKYPVPSSKTIYYLLDVYYYTNYVMTGVACSDEGCSNQSKTIWFRTEEHSPFCPPPNIQFYTTSSRSLRVTYDSLSHACLSGDLQFYGLLLFETEKYHEYASRNYSIEQMKLIATSYNETLSREVEYFHLHEYWNYTILVFAQNNGGMGVLSDPVYTMTDQDIPDELENCWTKHTSSSSFVLHIDKLERLRENGIVHYHIDIVDVFGNERHRDVEVEEGPVTTSMFTNLIKFTYHNISIKPVTVKGDGPAFLMYERTLEDVPSKPPVNFTVHNITNDSMTLVWQDIPPLSVHGVLQHFHIYGETQLRNGTWHRIHKDVTENQSPVLSLFPGRLYEFTIAGCTNPGCGAESYVSKETDEMSPSGVVTIENAPDITANTMHLVWSVINPMERRGDIVFYSINVTNLPNSWETFNQSISIIWISYTTQQLITALDNYTWYEVSIKAHTRVGPGPATVIKKWRTLQNVPSAPPINVTGYDTSSSSLIINWIPIHISDHEGVLIGYNISYAVVANFTEIRGTNIQGYVNCSYEDIWSSTCELLDLSLATPYDIQIAGYTEIGNGLWSEVVNITTGDFVDGGWTNFTKWGSCSHSCGLGKKMRQRWCVNPRPALGGKYCEGDHKDYGDCNYFPCPGYYLAKHGDDCSSTCSELGEQFGCAIILHTENNTEHFLETIDAYNFTKSTELSCNTTKATDGYKFKYDPSYISNGGICRGFVGVKADKVDCKVAPAGGVRRLCNCIDKISAQYTEWANWGLCTEPCGTGRYQRFRECILDEECTGNDLDVHDCNTQPCPIDGMWGQWTPFSNCSTTCGFGSQERVRFCDSPAPEFNGSYCAGNINSEILEGCNPTPCPIHGEWSSWSTLSECKHSCGSLGVRVSRRYCTNPAPLYDGEYCVGERIKNESCIDMTPCTFSSYVFVTRFLEETWVFNMYDPANELHRNLSQRIKNEIRKFYGSSIVPYVLDNAVIETHEMRRGSVIVTFSISYDGVPHLEALLLQHTIEGGMLNTMPVGLNDITVDNLPVEVPNYVVAESNSPFSINVSWQTFNNASYLHGDFYLYQVFFKTNESASQWDNFGTTNTSYEIVDLIPVTWYLIRVVIATQSGNGIASELIKIKTIEGVPYISPPSCEKKVVDSHTVYFSWQPIPVDKIPGILRGYRIRYRKYDEQNAWSQVVVDNTMDQITISNLQAYTFYWFEIAGFTNAGYGPFKVFVFRTPPGPPSVFPPNATVEDRYSTTEMIVTWDAIPIEMRNGYLAGYRLFYRKYQQSGKDVVGESFKIVSFDQFTFDYKMIGLESYTTYEIRLFGFNTYGEGPYITLLGATCKCPEYIFSAWYEHKPYIAQIGQIEGQVEGLFPDLLKMVVQNICTDCKTYTPSIYYDRTRSGRFSEKASVDEVKKYLDDDVHISFPIFGRFALVRFAGHYPFVGIIASQGSALIVYSPDYKTVGIVNILGAVVSAWPVILIAVLMAAIMGWVVWFCEQYASECDITKRKAIYGAYEGFWMAFVTMTTLGYGDYVPSSNLTKVVMVWFILIGLTIVSIFGGAVSTGMNVSSLPIEYKLYGTKVAAVVDTFEYRTAILRNAKLDESRNYTTISDVLDAVQHGDVALGIVDAITTQGYMDDLKARSLKIYKILDLESGYGVILSGEFARIEEDMRSFVSSNQAEISRFVQNKIGVLQPFVTNVEELLLTPDESESMLLFLVYLYCGMALVGICVSYGIKCYAKRRVHPVRNPDVVKHESLSELLTFFESFKSGYDQRMTQLDEKHTWERYRLVVVKNSYKRQMIRAGLTPQPDLKKTLRKKKAKSNLSEKLDKKKKKKKKRPEKKREKEETANVEANVEEIENQDKNDNKGMASIPEDNQPIERRSNYIVHERIDYENMVSAHYTYTQPEKPWTNKVYSYWRNMEEKRIAKKEDKKEQRLQREDDRKKLEEERTKLEVERRREAVDDELRNSAYEQTRVILVDQTSTGHTA